MFRVLGLNGLPIEALLMILVMLVICGIVTGWITDVIMGQMGFGVIGNTILTIMGAVVGMTAWNAYIGPLRIYDASISIGIASASSVVILLLFATFKRAVLR